MFDRLIAGGWIIDGTGAPAYQADLAINGERIAAIGVIPRDKAREVLDASGLAVAPGMIDAHVHGDLPLLADPTHEAAIRQGVTTYIIGQDGCGFAPASAETIRYMREYTAGFSGWFPDLACDWSTLEGYFARLHRHTSVNAAYLFGNGLARMAVMGLEERSATPDEFKRMKRMTREAMEAGAVGLSTGLDYIPSVYADTAELIELCKEIAPFGGVYVTHVRGNSRGGMHEALDEVFAIAQGSGAKPHVSHFNVRADVHLRRIDAARAAGFDATFDAYPYRAGMTILGMIALPPELQAGGTKATLERLADSAAGAAVDAWWARGPINPRNVRLAWVESERWSDLQGESLAGAAETMKLPFAEAIVTLLRDCQLRASAVVYDVNRTDADMHACLTHPAHMGCSDGIFVGRFPHPRGYGAFAKFLGPLVRDQRIWTIEEAIRHQTSVPAERYQLPDRGILRAGMVADLFVFDPFTIADRATFDRPKERAEGVAHVLVAGELTLHNGRHTGATAGQVLRRA